jgi:hypothetical protein
MGFLDNLFKKKDAPQPKDNRLEEALKRAAGEPAWRKTFYELLLSEKLVVITSGASDTDEDGVLKAGSTVSFASYPDGKIPVFTSVARVFDKQVIKEQVHQMTIMGRDLFELAAGATFLLNPYSDYGKELLPDEIADLLNGTLFLPTNQITVEKETPVLIGQPKVYPDKVVASLKLVFTKYPAVSAAYLGWMHNPESEDPPHYVFAVEGTSDIEDAIQEAGFVCKEHLPGQIFDLMRISGTAGATGIEGYFKESVKPFYKK